jgi:hemerythrin-like domain-containing protein
MLNLDNANDNTEIISEHTEDESDVVYSNSDNTSSSHYLKEVSSEKEEIEELNESDVIVCY